MLLRTIHCTYISIPRDVLSCVAEQGNMAVVPTSGRGPTILGPHDFMEGSDAFSWESGAGDGCTAGHWEGNRPRLRTRGCERRGELSGRSDGWRGHREEYPCLRRACDGR